jgi:hypothetical protein
MESLITEVQKSVIGSKKCMICESKKVKFYIKGILNDCYCKGCANDLFSDLGLLEKL